MLLNLHHNDKSPNIPQFLLDYNFISLELERQFLKIDALDICDSYNFALDLSSHSSRTTIKNKIISLYSTGALLDKCESIDASFDAFLNSILSFHVGGDIYKYKYLKYKQKYLSLKK